MKKFQPNKLKLSLRTLATPLLALSLMAGCAGLFSGSAFATNVTVSENVNSNWQSYYTANPECDQLFPDALMCNEELDPYSSISETWPLSYDGLNPGGSLWHFGPEDDKYLNNHDLLVSEIKGLTRAEHLRFSLESGNECKESRSIASATYKLKVRINSNGSGAYDNSGSMYLTLLDLNDGNNPVMISSTELTSANISTNFIDYSFEAPIGSLPITLGDLNKRYEILIMYGSGGASTGKTLSVDIDEASREIIYDDTSANCVPVITSPSSTTIPSFTASGSTVVPGSSLAATDTDGDTLTYSITAGNNSYFAIDPTTGNITTTSTNIPAGTYTITVQVDDGKGGTATAIATIVVTAENNVVPVANNTPNQPTPVKPNEPSKITLANTGSNALAVMTIAVLSLASAGLVKMRKFRA